MTDYILETIKCVCIASIILLILGIVFMPRLLLYDSYPQIVNGATEFCKEKNEYEAIKVDISIFSLKKAQVTCNTDGEFWNATFKTTFDKKCTVEGNPGECKLWEYVFEEEK